MRASTTTDHLDAEILQTEAMIERVMAVACIADIRSGAIEECNALVDALCDKLLALPAATTAGTVAKARVWLRYRRPHGGNDFVDDANIEACALDIVEALTGARALADVPSPSATSILLGEMGRRAV